MTLPVNSVGLSSVWFNCCLDLLFLRRLGFPLLLKDWSSGKVDGVNFDLPEVLSTGWAMVGTFLVLLGFGMWCSFTVVRCHCMKSNTTERQLPRQTKGINAWPSSHVTPSIWQCTYSYKKQWTPFLLQIKTITLLLKIQNTINKKTIG